MKCPKCDGEMEKGVLGDFGTSWNKEQGLVGLQNKFPKLGPKISAYRCPGCGKVELISTLGK